MSIVDESANLIRAMLWADSSGDKWQRYLEIKTALADERNMLFWREWARDVLDVDTANEFGLSMWSRILDISLGSESGETPTSVPFGFDPFGFNFGNGNFSASSSGNVLNLEQMRLVIKLRLYQITGSKSANDINSFFEEIFGAGEVYVIDNLNMTMSYYFSTDPSQDIRYILLNYDLLPRPAGVKVNWSSYAEPAFGFGPYSKNFDNGNFGA